MTNGESPECQLQKEVPSCLYRRLNGQCIHFSIRGVKESCTPVIKEITEKGPTRESLLAGLAIEAKRSKLKEKLFT